MKLSSTLTDAAILSELGQRLSQARLNSGLTQAELAEQAGVSKRTLERVEAGASTQLVTLIRLLRVLDLVTGLDQLIPQDSLSPMALLEEVKTGYRVNKKSKRVSHKKKSAHTKPWVWGDDP